MFPQYQIIVPCRNIRAISFFLFFFSPLQSIVCPFSFLFSFFFLFPPVTQLYLANLNIRLASRFIVDRTTRSFQSHQSQHTNKPLCDRLSVDRLSRVSRNFVDTHAGSRKHALYTSIFPTIFYDSCTTTVHGRRKSIYGCVTNLVSTSLKILYLYIYVLYIRTGALSLILFLNVINTKCAYSHVSMVVVSFGSFPCFTCLSPRLVRYSPPSITIKSGGFHSAFAFRLNIEINIALRRG